MSTPIETIFKACLDALYGYCFRALKEPDQSEIIRPQGNKCYEARPVVAPSGSSLETMATALRIDNTAPLEAGTGRSAVRQMYLIRTYADSTFYCFV